MVLGVIGVKMLVAKAGLADWYVMVGDGGRCGWDSESRLRLDAMRRSCFCRLLDIR